MAQASPEPGRPLSRGDRLGPYEIVEQLDEGGMGWVYRARDLRLRRDVAIKVLRDAQALTRDHFERLAREARAAGSLSHPNIVIVFDVGIDGPVPYIVTELLEGESLRERLKRGPLTCRKAIEYGVQIAQGLAAAHEKGLWHRDVKPGNAFVTKDGRVKLLDFGLVKHRERDPTASDESTADDTHPGGIHGTLGYMSPEQLLGQLVDHRTDIFALGAVLYEMLSGKPAFRRGSPVETNRAVLSEDPPDLAGVDPRIPPAVAATVQRCLEKNKDDRFQSARDLAFHLQQLIEVPAAKGTDKGRGRRVYRAVLGPLLALAVALLAYVTWKASPPPPSEFTQLTFRRARIGGARFASDGIVYGEAREGERREGEGQAGETLEVWWVNGTNDPQARLLGHRGSDVLAAHAGKLALSLGRRFVVGERFVGTLAEAPMGEGRPRPLGSDIEDADWSPSGKLVVVRCHGAGQPSTLESPIGQVLYQTAGSIRFPRFSRDGRRIAFLEDTSGLGSGGKVAFVDADRPTATATELTPSFGSAKGLMWSASGDEVWFTAGELRGNRALYAVDLKKRRRLVLPGAVSWTLRDIRLDGQVLLTREEERSAVVGLPPGQVSERDLSWFDTAGLADVSEDGRTLLFDDRFGVYLRDTDGSAPTDLGVKAGYAADDLSVDGKDVLATMDGSGRLLWIATGTGERTLLPTNGIISYRGALWLPNRRSVVVNGIMEPRGPLSSYIQDLDGGPIRPLTPRNTWATAVSPDGEWTAAIHTASTDSETAADRRSAVELYPVSGGDRRLLPTTVQGERAVSWSADGRRIWLFRRGQVPARIYELELETGRRTLWKVLAPADASGVYSITNIKVTPDGRLYFYSYDRVLSQMYVVKGLQ